MKTEITTEARKHGGGHPGPGGSEKNLHRNNAAEWVMWLVLYPVFIIARLARKR
jgi:hypothetical protein